VAAPCGKVIKPLWAALLEQVEEAWGCQGFVSFPSPVLSSEHARWSISSFALYLFRNALAKPVGETEERPISGVPYCATTVKSMSIQVKIRASKNNSTSFESAFTDFP